MSDTPRTDAQAPWIESPQLDFARQLERELAEAKFDLQFRRELYALQTKELEQSRDQRDRLAGALQRVDECLSNAEDVMHGAGSDDVSRARRVISDTLAAVKGGTP
jgi:hypothetical protein